MNTLVALQQKAITAAKQQDWQAAVDFNLSLLEYRPKDLGALNRLGVAYSQLGKPKKAQGAFKKVLDFDKSNSLAKKHLENLKKKQQANIPAFSKQHFIEEPGKTKTVELHRLAGKQVLQKLSVGQSCILKPKSRYISVETEEGIYIGALPEDLSYRLSKLIKTGNLYSCLVRSCSSCECNVYLKEEQRSRRNEHHNSFPLNKSTSTAVNDIDETVLLKENIPVEIVHTDHDTEKTLDDVSGEPEEKN